jgi:hypothetical protein
VHDAALETTLHLESGVEEHAHHAFVVQQHVRIEDLDVVIAGDGRKRFEQARADPESLQRIRYRKGGLRSHRGLRVLYVRRDPDQAMSRLGDQNELMLVIGAEQSPHLVVARGWNPEETEPQALSGEAVIQKAQPVRIVRTDRP